MNETVAQKIKRVRMMAQGTDDTWDLSDNDCAALQTVLEQRADLLEACKRARATLQDCAEDTAGTPESKLFALDVAACDAAIAKATGEAR